MNGSETGFRHPGSETETAGRARSDGVASSDGFVCVDSS